MSIFQEKISVSSDEPFYSTSPDEFKKIISNRRSVRVYKNEPIPENIVRSCLEQALLAPNSSNMQPWEFYWVKSPEKKQKLVEFCFSQNAAKTAAELFVAVARIDHIKKHRNQMIDLLLSSPNQPPKAVLDYYQKLVPLAYYTGPCSILAPFKYILFTLLGFFRPVPREPLSSFGLKLWAAKTTALACENLMLAFSSHGYDTCPMEGLDSHRVKKLLGLPSSSVVVMAISAGKRDPKGIYGNRIRFPSKQFLFEI